MEKMNETDETVRDMQKKKQKSNKQGWIHSWIGCGLAVCLVVAIIFTCSYGILYSKAQVYLDNPVENENTISYLYQNSYLLYRDLYNKQNQTNVDFSQIYMVPTEGNEWILDDEAVERISDGDYETAETAISENDLSVAVSVKQYLDNHFEELEDQFTQLNTNFDYRIEDTVTGEVISNMPDMDIIPAEQHFYLSFVFDEFGNVTIGNEVAGEDTGLICKQATEAMRYLSLQHLTESAMTGAANVFELSMPKNCRVIFSISEAGWQKMQSNGSYYFGNSYSVGQSQYSAFVNAGCGILCLLLLLVVFAAGMFLPFEAAGKSWREYKICRLPFEVLFCIGIVLAGLISELIDVIIGVSTGSAVNALGSFMGLSTGGGGQAVFLYGVVYLSNVLLLTAYLFGAWYLGVCARSIRELKPMGYLKEHSVIYRIFPTTKKKIVEIYDAVSHFDVTKSSKKLILKIVLTNAVVLFIISTLWLHGFWVTIIYSVILYFVLKKYISDIQKKYGILLGAINEIAQGNLNVNIPEDLGVFEPFKPQVFRIQMGFRKAVDEEVKSQRMKAELITNVSHDLKTPLTAIITYINLLKDENITPEQRKEYLDTLERKSLRLKVLIEDLFEVSKANTKNITLNIVDVDVVNLIKQVSFEMSDKLQNSNLEMRMDLPEEKVILPLDSQKTYRIYENLLGNIAKYAMPGTRVYVNGYANEENVVITFKNITAEEITVKAEELTDRFVRGDTSRNTEGSGLGLAIAKSFTELQGGELQVELDGDLFKVTTTWNIAKMTQV